MDFGFGDSGVDSIGAHDEEAAPFGRRNSFFGYMTMSRSNSVIHKSNNSSRRNSIKNHHLGEGRKTGLDVDRVEEDPNENLVTNQSSNSSSDDIKLGGISLEELESLQSKWNEDKQALQLEISNLTVGCQL